MFIRFTPNSVIAKYQRQSITALLIFTLVFSSVYYLVHTNIAKATTTYTWSGEELAQGTTASTTADEVVRLTPETTLTDTTREDFLLGYSDPTSLYSTAVADEAGGEVVLNQGWSYTAATEPGIASNSVSHTLISGNFLYVGTWGGGLSVINTYGTAYPDDDVVVAIYNTSSTPALPVGGSYPNAVTNIKKDGDLLYIGTYSTGLSVFDTKGTVDSSDDVLITTYNTASNPAIPNNAIDSLFLDTDNNLIYIGAFNGGANVINTQGTVDPSDDTFVMRYTIGTTPGLSGLNVEGMFIDTARNLLYISTNRGVSVINTQGTIDPLDDVLVIRYYNASTPAIPGGVWTEHSFLDDERNLLYISTYLGLSVINTQGTVDPSDDILVVTYNRSSAPAIGGNSVYHSFLEGNLLYISTYGGGVSVVDTKGTVDPNDDILVKTYDTDSVPSITSNSTSQSFLDNNQLYISTEGGLTVIDISGTYGPTATLVAIPQSLATTPTTSLSYTGEETADHDTVLSYRTGTADAVYRNDFDDGLTTEHIGDFYGWGSSFGTVEESGGTMKLSNPAFKVSGTGSYVDFWLDTGKPADYFPLGSRVTARARINSDTRELVEGWREFIYSDNWWDSDGVVFNNNQWYTFSFTASNKTFSKIGFEITWQTGTFAPTDTFEIDWIQITTPDSFGEWNTWQTCTTVPCAIDPATLAGNAWIQYKLDLTTTNPATTPKVTSVSYQGDYAPSGTYTSQTETFPRTQELLTFDVAHTVPASTTANYEYSLDNGGTWQTITPGTAFPEGTLARSFTWRTTFTTTNPATTPTLTSVTLTTYTPNKSSSTAIKTRVANLEAAGKVAEATAIRTRFPHLFTDSAPPDLAIQAEFIEILEETVFVLRRVIELREET